MHQNAIKSLKLLTFSAFFFCKISVFFFAFFSVFFTFFLVKKVRMIVWSKRHVTETINSVAIWKNSQENVHLWTPSGWLFYQGGGTTWTLENASAQNAKNAKSTNIHKKTQVAWIFLQELLWAVHFSAMEDILTGLVADQLPKVIVPPCPPVRSPPKDLPNFQPKSNVDLPSNWENAPKSVGQFSLDSYSMS